MKMNLWYFILIVWWIFGIALVKGLGLTLAAFIFPPYAWVAVCMWAIERWLS